MLLTIIGTVVHAQPAGADTTTFTSGQVGSSGQTAPFYEGGLWSMAWSYDCTAYGYPGNFFVDINPPPGDSTFDIGPNELGTSGSGVDYYVDTGTSASRSSASATGQLPYLGQMHPHRPRRPLPPRPLLPPHLQRLSGWRQQLLMVVGTGSPGPTVRVQLRRCSVLRRCEWNESQSTDRWDRGYPRQSRVLARRV